MSYEEIKFYLNNLKQINSKYSNYNLWMKGQGPNEWHF